MYFVMLVTHSVNVHVNTRAKGNPIKAVRAGSIILRFERSKTELVPKVIKRPGVSEIAIIYRINSVDLVCVVMCEDHKL